MYDVSIHCALSLFHSVHLISLTPTDIAVHSFACMWSFAELYE